MNALFLCGIAMLAAALTVVLREAGSPLARYVPAAAGVVLSFRISAALTENANLFGSFSIPSAAVPYMKLLLRCFGVCVCVHFTADFIRDLGLPILADRLELCGKCAAILLLLPLLQQILALAAKMMGLT